MNTPIRIAMWSGPRNLSTAMMRSFGARSDTGVMDEPFYAAYLALSGRDHPMAAEVMAHHETDPGRVAEMISGEAPGGAAVFYQKHMVQHMVPGIPRDWFGTCRHAILIRHPARALASFSDKVSHPAVADLGLGETEDILGEIIRATGKAPPVVEAEDMRNHPEAMLARLCAALGIAYDPAMLRWEPGIHDSDGIWASHWYGAVARSTGFAAADTALPDLPPALAEIAESLMPAFSRLQSGKLVP